jgi:ferredoxin
VSIRVRVDDELCQGHARCGLTAPEVFGLSDEDGHAVVLCDPVPSEYEAAARRAVIGCPERALQLLEE